MARELSELSVTTRQGGINNTLIVTVTHLPTGCVAEALAHTKAEAKQVAYRRLAEQAKVKAWLKGGR